MKVGNISPYTTITAKLLQDSEIVSTSKCGVLMESLAMVSSLPSGPCLVWAMFAYIILFQTLKRSSVLSLTPPQPPQKKQTKKHLPISLANLTKHNWRIMMGLSWPFDHATFFSLMFHPENGPLAMENPLVLLLYGKDISPPRVLIKRMVTNCSSSLWRI